MTKETRLKNKLFKENIEVTSIFIRNLNPDGKYIKAYVDICINDCLCIRGLRIIDGCNGCFVGMPQMEISQGCYYDLVFFSNKEIRDLISKKVLDQYSDITSEYLYGKEETKHENT